MFTFEDGEMDYNDQDHSYDSGTSGTPRKKKSIKSKSSVDLVGPMDIDGSVKAMGNVSFVGTFGIRDRVEAYGNVTVSGYLSCNDKIKCYGNLDISGTVFCGSKVSVYGQLIVHGHLEVRGTIEVWGAVSIEGYMKCNTLVAYSSVTTVGDESYYDVEESETIWGAKMIRRTADEAELLQANHLNGGWVQ